MITVGSTVLVDVPVGDDTKMLVKFNEMETVVTNKRSIKVNENRQTLYELKYCESVFGIPYSFMKEWLVEIDG